MTDKITLELTLDELELIDKHIEYNEETKSVFDKIKYAYPQLKMTLQQEGDYAVVSYNDTTYYRFEDATCFSWYIKKGVSANYTLPTLVMITDGETERLLEGLYYNHIVVKKEKEQQTKSPVEEAYKDWRGEYPGTGTWDSFDETRWIGFQAGYEVAYAISTAKEVMEESVRESVENKNKDPLECPTTPKPFMNNCIITGNPPNGYSSWSDWYNELGSKGILVNLRISSNECKPTLKSPEETEQSLKEAFREAVKQGVIPPVEKSKESWMDKPIDELVDILEKNPPDCLKFQLGKTLEQLIERWWCDVFTSKKYDWDMETAIQDLCDRIFLWLPKEQDSSGTQRIETIIAVDTHNELLNKIKSKIHNKK